MRALALIVAWIGLVLVVAHAQSSAADRPVPLASDFERAFASFAIARDGSRLTVRSVAPDSLVLCVQSTNAAGSTCFSAGDVRHGRLVKR